MNHLFKRILTVGASLALAAAVAVPALAAETPATPATNAVIDVTKIVTTDTASTFPLSDSYTFTLEPYAVVMGRDEGTQYTTATMPMPDTAAVGTALEKTVSGLASDDGVNDTTTKRDRTLAFEAITFENTGIYTYKLTEKVPTGTGMEAGVTYDKSEYFVNVYVTNVLNDDNTPALDTDGSLKTTISSITLYKGENGNIELQGKDFNDVPANQSNADAKVDITTTPKNDDLTTFVMDVPFTNTFDVENLTILKTVTGNLGDPDKTFTFTFTPNNAPVGYSYAYKVFTMAGTAPAGTDKEVTGKDDTFDKTHSTVTLQHKQYAVVYGVPVGLEYTVTEAADATYITNIAWQNGNDGVADDHGTLGDTTTSVPTTGIHTIKTTTMANGETGNRDNHEYFTNNKQGTPPTGVLLRFAPFALLAVLLVLGIVFVAMNAKKRRENGYQGL